MNTSSICLSKENLLLTGSSLETFLYTVVFPPLCLFGLIGNALTISVLLSHEMMSRANIFLTCLAVCDICFLILIIPHSMANFDVIALHISFRQIYLNYKINLISFTNFFSALGIWLVVGVSFERVVGVRWPLHRLSKPSSRRLATGLILLVASCFLLTFYFHFGHYCVTKSICNGRQLISTCFDVDIDIWPGNRTNVSPIFLRRYVRWARMAHAVFILIVPLILLISLNIMLFYYVKKRSFFLYASLGKVSQRMRRPGEAALPFVGTLFRRHSDQILQQKVEHRVAVTVCYVVIGFTITQAPSVAVLCVNTLYPDINNSWKKQWYTLTQVTSFLVIFGKSINFVIFCLSSSSFRQRLLSYIKSRYGKNEKRMDSFDGFSVLFGRTRHLILLLSLLCLTFSFSNHLVFSFTVICMKDVVSTNGSHWLQSPTELNSLFSAVALGCLVGTLPVSLLVQLYGVRVTCALYGIISSLATFFFPFSIQFGYPIVFILRVIQGIPVSLSYPIMGQISAQWGTVKGLGVFIAILSCHMQLCSIITMPVSSLFCDSSISWRGSYYFHGILSFLTFALFFFFYHDEPHKHRTVSSNELEKISRGKGHIGANKNVPYRKILRDPCVWSIWASLLGSTFGIQLFLLYGPIYMNKILGLDIRSTGWGTAFPFLLAAIVKIIIGPISDKAAFVSPRIRLIFFTMLSQWGMALCLIVMSRTNSPSIAQYSYTIAIVFSGVICVGSIRGASMVYRQHVYFVMAVASLLVVLSIFLLPVVVAFICPNNSPDEWSRMMIFTAILVAVGSTPYIFFSRDKPADCTGKVQVETTQEKESENL